MIVPMKKVTVLCVERDRDRTLEKLRELGVLHLHHVRTPEGDDVEEARRYLAHVRRALEVLPRRSAGKPSGRPADEVVAGIWEVIHRRKDLEEKLAELRHERERILPFGDFDPAAVRALEEKGVFIRLYRVGPRKKISVPDDAVVVETYRDRTGVFFAVVARERIEIDAEEVKLPERSLGELEEDIRSTREGIQQAERDFEAFGGDYAVVVRAVEEAEERLLYLEARFGMGVSDPVAYLQGYSPADAVPAIEQAARSLGWGLVIEDPAPGEPVPTLIRTPRWVDPIKSVFEMLGIIPGYDEVDISAVFLVFFSIFFAVLVGDAGYGALFLGATLWARRRFRRAPRRIFRLLLLMSVTTIIWGVLTGTYFGIGRIPAVLDRLRIGWLGDSQHMIELCFLIGAVHLSLAHAWNAWLSRRSLRAVAQLGWFCTTWTMFFVARTMVLGFAFPGKLLYVFFAAVAAIVLFSTPLKELKKQWFDHVMLPLNIIGNFVDLVSYVRLFAVGAATLAVASAFNDMAGGMGGGVLAGLGAALILFVGHAMNIMMAIMGVMVHGIRLNTLEFSNHIGIQWKGIFYRPFARRPAAEDSSEP